ncbi:MAG TPA: hypothetical protein VNA20_07590 [Frankiaceae bacterium]|nr:hypothetical protein [Frankiaceae bacterium]
MEPGVQRRSAAGIVVLILVALVCAVGAFFGFIIGMACEPDAGVGCDPDTAERQREIAYAVALIAAGIGTAALGAAVKPKAAVVAAASLVGVAAVGYAITQVN